MAHFFDANLRPWAAALAAALFAPAPAQPSLRRSERRARGVERHSVGERAPERKSPRVASRGVSAAPARRRSVTPLAVSRAARRGSAWQQLEELRQLDGAVDAVLRASQLPLFEQLPRTPAEWQPAVIGSRTAAGALELSYREADACCDATHAVRGVHTLTLHSRRAGEAAT